MMRDRLQLLITIVRTHRLLIFLTSLCVTVLLLVTYRPKPAPYTAVASFWIGEAPLSSTQSSDEERYFNWVTSEYVTIALASWVEGSEFLSQVRWRLWLQDERLSLDDLTKMIDASVNRSGIRLIVQHPDEMMALTVASAAADAFEEAETVTLPQLENSRVMVSRLDDLVLAESPETTVREQLELPLRIMFGLLSGLIVALLAQRPNNMIHDRQAIATLNLAVVGEIPSETRPLFLDNES